MITFSRAPARLGLGGGGTDIAEYFENHKGAVLNATIAQYVYCTITYKNTELSCRSIDKGLRENSEAAETNLPLHWATINYFKRNLNVEPMKIELSTFTDIPEGSGLGTSSALVVAMVTALAHHHKIDLSREELVKAAYTIERKICAISGGYQDFIASVYGGFNFTEFNGLDDFLVHPLKIQRSKLIELENTLFLIFTGLSRSSSKIIKDQSASIHDINRLNQMHKVKEAAYDLKKHLIKGDYTSFKNVFRDAWEAKKLTSSSITNPTIDEVEKQLFQRGAEAIKISGAGGGGFMMVFGDETRVLELKDWAKKNHNVRDVSFTQHGVEAWSR